MNHRTPLHVRDRSAQYFMSDWGSVSFTTKHEAEHVGDWIAFFPFEIRVGEQRR